MLDGDGGGGLRSTALSADDPIDLRHLARATMDNVDLRNEVLGLFERQTEMLLPRMRAEGLAGIPALAHALKGSARGIGAGPVALAAEAVEAAALARDASATARSLDILAAAVARAHSAIAALRAG